MKLVSDGVEMRRYMISGCVLMLCVLYMAGCGPKGEPAPAPAAKSGKASEPAKNKFKIAFSQCNSA